jgi:hypothetical protein
MWEKDITRENDWKDAANCVEALYDIQATLCVLGWSTKHYKGVQGEFNCGHTKADNEIRYHEGWERSQDCRWPED